MTIFLGMGIMAKPTKWLLHSIILSGLAYLLVFQGGNVQHEYYQTLILPGIAIGIGLGIAFLFDNKQLFFHQVVSTVIVIACLGASSFFSYFYKVKDFYAYPKDLLPIARIISTLTKQTDLVITDRTGDTTLLYLADRKGSPADSFELSEAKTKGYAYFVTTNKERIEKIKELNIQTIVFENDEFALIKL
jgi:hypothetical protein